MTSVSVATWDRQEKEPSLWYGRFDLYRAMGPERTLLGALNAYEAQRGAGKRYTSVPGAWLKQFNAWRWKERAEVWDDAQRQLRRERESAEAEEEHARRLEMYKAWRQILTRGLAKVVKDESKVDGLSVPTQIAALDTLSRLQRTEYGEASVITRHEQTGLGGGPIKTETAVNAYATLLDAVGASLDLADVRAIQAIREKVLAKRPDLDRANVGNVLVSLLATGGVSSDTGKGVAG